MKRRKRGRRPRCVGTVALHDTGREANVYCSWRPPALKHDVLLTGQLLKFGLPMLNYLRGINTNSEYRPDAEIGKLMIEFDNDTEKKNQVQRQAKRYDNCKSTVLWVFQNIKRFSWITEVANASNTLVMLAGTEEMYDMRGNPLSVKDLGSIV